MAELTDDDAIRIAEERLAKSAPAVRTPMPAGAAELTDDDAIAIAERRLAQNSATGAGSVTVAAPALDKAPTSASSAYLRGTLSGIPIAGEAIAGGLDRLAAGARSALRPDAGTYDEELAKVQGFAEADRKAHPVAATAGQITGGVAGTLPLVVGAPALFGANAASGLARAGISGAANATLAGTDTLARGGTLKEAGKSALIAGTIGAILKPGAPAPTTAQLTAERAAMQAEKAAAYAASEQAGVMATPQAFQTFTQGLETRLAAEHINRGITPKALAALGAIQDVATATRTPGAALNTLPTLKTIDNLRQYAGRLRREAGDASEGHMLGIIIRGIDDFTRSPPSSFVSRGNANPRVAIEALEHGREVAARQFRSETIEKIITDAAVQGTGNSFANGIKNGFARLARDTDEMRVFNAAETRAIRLIGKTTTPTGIARAVGNLSRMATWQGASGSAGAAAAGFALGGGPVGAAIGAVGLPAASAVVGRIGDATLGRAARRLEGGVQRGNLQPLPLSRAGTLGAAVGSAAALTAARPPPKRRQKR